MKKLITTVSVGVLCSMTSFAHDGAGMRSVHLGVDQGTATQIYAGSDKVNIPAALPQKRTVTNYSLSSEYATSENSHFDLGVTYSNIENDVADVTAGGAKSVGGIGELGARYMHSVFSASDFNVDLGFGVRTPGDNRGGGSFSSLSDGLTKYDYYLGLGYSMGMFGVGLTERYTDRSSPDSKPQNLVDLVVSVLPMPALQVALEYQVFTTTGGPDILGAGFTFANIKEEYNALGVSVAYQCDQHYVMDARYGTKLTGRNTDANTTAGVGVTYLY